MSRKIWPLLIFVVLVGCAKDVTEDIPSAPSMSAIEQAYATPTMPLTAENVAKVSGAFADMLNLTGAMCGWSSVDSLCSGEGCDASCGGVSALFDMVGVAVAVGGETEAQDGALHIEVSTPEAIRKNRGPFLTREQALSLDGDVALVVRRICDGFSGAEVADENDGKIELNVLGSASTNGLTINPVIWGQFTKCKYLVDGQELFIDGAVNISVGDVFSGGDLTSLTMLFEIDATELRFGGETLNGQMSFRVQPSTGAVEFILEADGQHAIFFTQGTTLGLRASDGTWACDLTKAESCFSGSSSPLQLFNDAGDLTQLLLP